MTSRERILTALAHEEPDRVPFDFSSTPVSGIHHIAYRRLRKTLGLPEIEPTIWHMMQQLAWVDEDVHEALATDAKGLRPQAQASWTLRMDEDAEFRYYTDEWGVTRRMRKDEGYYFDLCASPIPEVDTPEELERYAFPDPIDPARFVGLRESAERTRAEGRAFVLGGICPGMLEVGELLMGFENYLCHLAGNLCLVEALCDRILDLKLRYWERVLSLMGDMVDVVQEGDDYGGQHGLLVSPQLFREVFKPRLAVLIPRIKALAPHVRVFFHSCGSICEIIPDLIEVGVDIINPVQVAARGMDSRELKREFGSAISFWGGGVDTQRVLPCGTPAEVRDEVQRRISDLAPGGGFVFNTVHNIQADVPPENILAMRQAVRDFGSYR